MGRGEEWRDTEFKGVISENVAGGTRKSNHIFPCRFLFFFFSFFVGKMRVHSNPCVKHSPRYRFFLPYGFSLPTRDFLTRECDPLGWILIREED